jgi:hypothetical protein
MPHARPYILPFLIDSQNSRSFSSSPQSYPSEQWHITRYHIRTTTLIITRIIRPFQEQDTDPGGFGLVTECVTIIVSAVSKTFLASRDQTYSSAVTDIDLPAGDGQTEPGWILMSKTSAPERRRGPTGKKRPITSGPDGTRERKLMGCHRECRQSETHGPGLGLVGTVPEIMRRSILDVYMEITSSTTTMVSWGRRYM